MALDDYISEANKSNEDDSDTDDAPDEKSRKKTTKECIALNIKDRVWNTDLDIELNDGRVEGDINDIALLFALMTMDFSDSEFQSLVTDDVEN